MRRWLAAAALGSAITVAHSAAAQDVPGIEICTVDKTMERRTSCLQSNVDFLMKTISRLRSDHDAKLDAAARDIAALRVSVAGLQKSLAELQPKAAAAPVSKDAPASKDNTAGEKPATPQMQNK
jgi:hypothetical protein